MVKHLAYKTDSLVHDYRLVLTEVYGGTVVDTICKAQQSVNNIVDISEIALLFAVTPYRKRVLSYESPGNPG